jgi:coenzyme Q-binding protein COQ10
LIHHHHVERVLPYTPNQLFDLVGDVRAYPKFIPWISSIRTGVERREGDGVSVLDADASVGFSVIKERFATRVRRDSAEPAIEVKLISGPFKQLLNRWKFEAHPTGTKIIFDIDFEFKSKLLDLMLRQNFDYAVQRLIGCFEDRAAALYGREVLGV